MMLQTKHKYFNNKIKIVLLILMWTLIWQHVNGKSSTYDGTIVAAAVAYDSGVEGSGSGSGGGAGDETTMKKMKTKTTSTAKNDGNNNNNATINGHINENDNNCNKLPQNVEKRDQRQSKMMMQIDIPPPTEQMLMAKDQLNKTEDKVPQDKTDYEYKNKQDENKEFKMSMAKVNDPIMYHDVTIVPNNDESLTVIGNVDGEVGTDNSKPDCTKNVTKFTNDEAHRNEHNVDETSSKTVLLKQLLISQFATVYKQIPRVTFFTCRHPSASMFNKIYKRQTNMNKSIVELLRRMIPAERSSRRLADDFMLKVVQIDHLASKRRTTINSAKPRLRFGGGRIGGESSASVGRVAGGGQVCRQTFTNANWLAKILPVEPFRQIVALDLSCGSSSRRLLEMASNKALFNSMYHWLLMEDYLFNRQTEVDDADEDIKNKLSSNSNSTNTNCGSRSSKEEVVNDSKSTIQVKKLSTYSSDVVGASASGSYKLYKRQDSTSSSNTAACSNVDTVREVAEGDGEIIENFLEKLNININTELILAKRHMRGMAATSATSSVMMPSLTSSATSESNDYNTLQKMDYSYYKLYDVWSPGLQYGGELNVSEIGKFSHNDGFEIANWYRNTSTITRRLNMKMTKVRCLVVITHKNRSDTLEEYLTTHYDTHLDSMNRFNFALLSHVRDVFNFSFILSKTSTWGYLKNGKFDGMIGALVRKQADIGGSPIFFRIERAKVIDYTTRTWVARPCFMFRHPRSTKKDRIVFLQPFSNDVWIFLALCGCITIFLLCILTSLERNFNPTEEFATYQSTRGGTGNEGGLKRYHLKWGGIFTGTKRRAGFFFESFLFYIGSICQQGLAYSTRLFSGRCIVITSLLFSFSIYQFYSASIVGTLLMEKPKTIRTLRDLIHSSLEIGIEDIVYNRDYFLRTKDPDAQELYAKKVTSMPTTGDTGFVDAPLYNAALPTQVTVLTDSKKAKAYRDILHSHETGAHAKTNQASNWYDPDFGVAKIRNGLFAFHVDVATAYKIIADTFNEKEICDLTEIQLFPPQKMMSIVQKGSPLRKIITFGLRRVTEVGLTDYERNVWHSPKPRCIKKLHAGDLRVDMQTFTSALLVLIFGYAVSLLILGLEIMHYKLWQRYTASTTTTTTTTTS